MEVAAGMPAYETLHNLFTGSHEITAFLDKEDATCVLTACSQKEQWLSWHSGLEFVA